MAAWTQAGSRPVGRPSEWGHGSSWTFGGTFDIADIALDLGLRAQDAQLGDLLCRNNRPSYLLVVFDDGAGSLVASPRADANTIPRTGLTLMRRMTRIPSARTRKVRLVIQQVEDPVDGRDVGIAEIRLFGEPAADHVSQSSGECATSGHVPFTHALIAYGAGLDTTETARLRCGELVLAFPGCKGTGPF